MGVTWLRKNQDTAYWVDLISQKHIVLCLKIELYCVVFVRIQLDIERLHKKIKRQNNNILTGLTII